VKPGVIARVEAQKQSRRGKLTAGLRIATAAGVRLADEAAERSRLPAAGIMMQKSVVRFIWRSEVL
jgi:hypothetical protein